MKREEKNQDKSIKRAKRKEPRQDKSGRFKFQQEEIAKSFKEVVSKEREKVLGGQKDSGEKLNEGEKKRIIFMWGIVILIMIVVIILWIFSFKSNIPEKKEASEKDEAAEIWNEMKKNINQFSENLNNLFSQMGQLNQTKENANLSDEELKKLTNEVLKNLKQGATDANTNADNSNVNVIK